MRYYKCTKGFTIFQQLLITFLSTTIVITGLLSYTFYAFTRKAHLEHADYHVRYEFSSIDKLFDYYFAEFLFYNLHLLSTNQQIDALAALQAKGNPSPEQVERVFQRFIAHSRNYRSIFFIDASGRERARVAGEKPVREFRNFAETPFFRELAAGKSDTIAITKPFLNEHKEPVFTAGIMKALNDTGEFAGVIAIDYELEQFFDSLNAIQVYGIKPVWLYAPDGTLLSASAASGGDVATDPAAYLKKDIQDTLSILSLNDRFIAYKDYNILPGSPCCASP